jgi:hypothetical protein
MNKLALAFAALTLAASAFAADKVVSGLQKGESATPFDVVDLNGPFKGTQVCYV